MSTQQFNGLSVEDYLFQEKLKTNSAWYCPIKDYGPKNEDGVMLRPETIYIGESNGRPTWEEPVFNVAAYRKAKTAMRQGSLNPSEVLHSPWLNTEWDEAAKIRADVLKYGKSYLNSPFRQASGVINSGDFSAINVIQIMGEILGEDTRDYVLEQAVTVAATPSLNMSIDQWSGFTGSTDVAEAQEPLVKKGAFARTEYLLKKQAVAVAITDEASIRYERDVWAQHLRQAQIAMRRDKNQRIATELETPTGVPAGDWLAWTTDHRTRDATRDIWVAMDSIMSNGGNPNTIASHPRVYNDFVVNTSGPLAAAQQQAVNSQVVNVPILGGATWYLDILKTNTLATVYDKSAVVFMQGPVKTEQWRIPGKLINAYATFDFNRVKIVDTTRIYEITGVSA